jgi:hypothetical protein
MLAIGGGDSYGTYTELLACHLVFQAGRFGRGLRMSALAQQIGQSCFYEDVENAETHKERMTWWIESVVRSDSDNH